MRWSALLFKIVGTVAVFNLISCGENLAVHKATSNDGWVSSGGELLRDTQNPWWIKNTKTVNYCIIFDAGSMSTSPATAQRLVKEAIAYWKKEFAPNPTFFPLPERFLGGTRDGGMTLVPADSSTNPLGIATQEFIETPCAQAKLKFQFGYGTLDDDQKDYLKRSRYIGAAIRTHYDPVQLQGEGVILIASDRGEHNFTSGASVTLVDPWLNETWLLSVLVHELGHALGIAHTGPRFSLMSEKFPETLITHRMWSMPAITGVTHKDLASFFHPTYADTMTCQPDLKKAWDYFEVPIPEHRGGSKLSCLGMSLDSAKRQINLWTFDEAKPSERVPVGQFLTNKFQYDIHPVVIFEVPSEQKVFTPAEMESRFSYIYGAYVIDSALGAGTYQSVAGKKKAVGVGFSGPGLWNMRLTGQVGDEFVPLVGWHSIVF